MAEKNDNPGERIAKVIARAGLASRREAEAWIAAGRVAVNGSVISSPALNVTAADRIVVDGAPLRARERTRLFLYHKPRGLVTTHSDPEGRDTIFRALPRNLPRLISVGRLDINTEGLLLLTNDGGLARVLELPATGWLRRYRVRALGRVRQEALDRLRGGITIDGIRYGPIEATLDREQGANVWLTFGIREGKNREVRKVLESLGLKVNRLIRVAFGPFDLGDLDDGAVREIETSELRTTLGEQIVADSGADFDAPVLEEKPEQPPRHSRESPTGPRKARPDGKLRPEHRSKERPRNDKKAARRRDRSGGPRPKYPRER
jgi:23S rRNA pseudouridine2605 synthase